MHCICDFHSLAHRGHFHVGILCILFFWNMIRFIDDDDEEQRKTDTNWHAWRKTSRVYLVRGTGYPWSEWLNAISWPLIVKTTSNPNFLPDDRGAILFVPSEIVSWRKHRKEGVSAIFTNVPHQWDRKTLSRAVQGRHTRLWYIYQFATLVTFTSNAWRNIAGWFCKQGIGARIRANI